MLLKFTVKNFLSFRDLQTLSLETTPRSAEISKNEISKTRSVFIYGPNSSGKSNLLKAIEFSNSIISDSRQWAEQIRNKDAVVPKNQRCTYFEYIIRIGNQEYAYGLELQITKTKNKLHSEWLYLLTPEGDHEIFTIDHINKKLKFNPLSNDYPNNRQNTKSVVITYGSPLLQTYNHGCGLDIGTLIVLRNLRFWFLSSIKCRTTTFDNFEFPVEISFFKQLEKQLIDFDTGITGIVLVPFKNLDIPHNLTTYEKDPIYSEIGPDDCDYITYICGNESKLYWLIYGAFENGTRRYYEVRFRHEGDYLARIDEESLGTREIIRYLSMLNWTAACNSGGADRIMVIDEIECSLHPQAVIKFLKQVNNCSANVQLVATTHETQILASDEVDPFEIWFVDNTHKKNEGTILYPLYTFGLPKENCLKMYMEGRFHSLPHLTSARRFN